MVNIKSVFHRLIYAQNWNIGFCFITPERLLEEGALPRVRWLKHNYRDRWFADPFLFKITETDYRVFAEELFINSGKGQIVELYIDRHSFKLKKRYLILELDTHLSFPIWYEKDNQIFVYPENGQSGKLSLYRYNEDVHSLEFIKVIVEDSLADSVIFENKEKYYLLATRASNSLSGTYLYESSAIDGLYMEKEGNPIITGIDISRSAGNMIKVGGKIYRPVQNCIKRYGGGISLIELSDNFGFKRIVSSIIPNSWRYNLGIHTINFMNNVCVVDSYGFLYPIFGRIYYSKIITKLKLLFFKRKTSDN